MVLVMFDVDGTLTQSSVYDAALFARAVGDVTGHPFADTDWHSYTHITSAGIVPEAIARAAGRPATPAEIREVENRMLELLEEHRRTHPEEFIEVPGASAFLVQIKRHPRLGAAIATGCWRNEARFKLQASRINVSGIPLVTSTDHPVREEIMRISVQQSLGFYRATQLDGVVYLGDAHWDLKAARALGFGFVAIGEQWMERRQEGARFGHADYSRPAAVFASIEAEIEAISAG